MSISQGLPTTQIERSLDLVTGESARLGPLETVWSGPSESLKEKSPIADERDRGTDQTAPGRIAMSRKFDDNDVRARMIRFIKTHYANTLGKDIELLDQPGGLDKLHKKYCL